MRDWRPHVARTGRLVGPGTIAGQDFEARMLGEWARPAAGAWG